MSYSARCMRIGLPLDRAAPGRINEAYKLGHRDARHAAAEIAAEADAEVHDVRAALQGLRAKHAEADATIAQLVAALEAAEPQLIGPARLAALAALANAKRT